jgi:hypothetical protein
MSLDHHVALQGMPVFVPVADERNGSPTALMQSLKHCKVLHRHDNLTGSPISPTPERGSLRYGQAGSSIRALESLQSPRLALPLSGGKGNPCEKENGEPL